MQACRFWLVRLFVRERGRRPEALSIAKKTGLVATAAGDLPIKRHARRRIVRRTIRGIFAVIVEQRERMVASLFFAGKVQVCWMFRLSAWSSSRGHVVLGGL